MMGSRLRRLRLYGSAVRHIPPKSLLLHVRRKARERGVTRRFASLVMPPDPATQARWLAGLAKPAFRAAARRQQAFARDLYTFDLDRLLFTFRKSGDVADLGQAAGITWRTPGAIPASDLNRVFHIAFLDHLPLAAAQGGEAALAHMTAMVDLLDTAGVPTDGHLTIPWQPLPAARRSANLLFTLALLLEAEPAMAGDSRLPSILTHVRTCQRVLDRLREDDLGYNHLATDLFGQCVFAGVSGDTGLLQKRARGFLAAMEAQVGGDGYQLERSATYQAHMLAHLDVLMAGDLLPGDAGARGAALADAMRRALAVMTHPDGGFAIFNDSAEGDGPSPGSLHVDLAGAASGIRRLAEAGFVRIDGGPFALILDAGRCGPDDAPGHAHADFLSVELSVGAHRLIVDPGVASYKAGPERAWSRSSHSHNGPGFGQLEPMEMFGAWRVGRRGRAFETSAPAQPPLAAVASHDGFNRQGARVARAVGVWPEGGVVVADAWRGSAVLTPTSSWLLDATWELTQKEPFYALLQGPDGLQLRLDAVGASLAYGSGRHFRFGPRVPLPATELRLEPGRTNGGWCAALVVRIIPPRGAMIEVSPEIVQGLMQSARRALDVKPPR